MLTRLVLYSGHQLCHPHWMDHRLDDHSSAGDHLLEETGDQGGEQNQAGLSV
jgi:hypothetical protein